MAPPADLLPSILGNYVGTPVHPVTPLEGIFNQFRSTPILYAQGSTLADGVGVPVPRTAFGLNKGPEDRVLRHARLDRPPRGHDHRARGAGRLGKRQAGTRSGHAQLLRPLDRHAGRARSGHYVFTLEPGDSFPYSPEEAYRFLLDGKVISAKVACAQGQ